MKLIKKSLCLYIAFVLLAPLDCLCIGKGYFFMKEIQLNKGFKTQVDDEDYEYLNQFKWMVHAHHGNHYAIRTHRENGTRCKWSMHRIILGLTDRKQICDHKDRNGLNNQKSNLRICTASENAKNRISQKTSTSKYLGVHKGIKRKTYMTQRGLVTNVKEVYQAQIYANNKDIYLGRFPCTPEGEVLAAKCYDEAAKKYHGEFASLNFPNG